MEDDKLSELKESITLANQVLKDLKQERKRAEELIKDFVVKLEKDIGAELVKQLDELGKATQNAMDAATARVFRKFDELAAIMMGEDKHSKDTPSIPELIRYRESLKEKF